MEFASAPTLADGEPYELVSVQPREEVAVDPAIRPRLLVHTVHDGDLLPPRFARTIGDSPAKHKSLLRAYVRERDWGANLVAGRIARELGLSQYGRVNLARVLLDFNRFPGTTPPGNRDPLERLSINAPFSSVLAHGEKMALLDEYDRISAILEPHLRSKLIILGVHTYDELNPSATTRPHLSIVNRTASYQREARMPYGVFDPLYPDVLGESSCSRVLRDRISLNLERAGFRCSSNHPYALPEGSIEVRSQVWYFFNFVRQRFEAQAADTIEDPAFSLVWDMLLNTNLRHARAEALRGYLHRYRRVGAAEQPLFEGAQTAYERIRAFVADSDVVRAYRRSAQRPSSLALEVRKDLLCEMDPDTGFPRPATEKMHDVADRVAKVVAGAIRLYFENDRDELLRT